MGWDVTVEETGKTVTEFNLLETGKKGRMN